MGHNRWNIWYGFINYDQLFKRNMNILNSNSTLIRIVRQIVTSNVLQYVTIWNESAYKWTITFPQDKYHFR